MSSRRLHVGLVALAVATAACFDSDDKFKQAVGTGTSTGDLTTTSTTTTGIDPTTGSTSTGEPDVTCRDAIDCIFECAAIIQGQLMVDPYYEPDLSCFLDCEEELTVDEALKLLRLGNCASDQCAAMGDCAMGTSTGGGSDSGTDTGTGTGTSTGGGDGGLLDPCIMCIFVLMLDEEYQGCEEFALACQ